MCIRLSKHVFLHIGFLFSAILCVFTPYRRIYLRTLLAALMHELCHLFAAFSLRVPIRRLMILPWGCSLRLARMDTRAEGLIAFAGPFASLIFACLFSALSKKEFSVIHFRLFLFNLLPALPLDGGRLLQLFLRRHCGFLRGRDYMRRISVFVSVFLVLFGITQGAFSACIAAIIICMDLRLAPPPLSPLLLKKAVHSKTKIISVSETDSLLHLLRYYSPYYTALFYVAPSHKFLQEDALSAYLKTQGANGTVYSLPPALFRTDFLHSRGDIPCCLRKKSPK